MSAPVIEWAGISFPSDGFYRFVTGTDDALSSVAYLYESGTWFIPDPDFNEASLVGARFTRLIDAPPIEEIHSQNSRFPYYCKSCRQPYPCRTIKAVNS